MKTRWTKPALARCALALVIAGATCASRSHAEQTSKPAEAAPMSSLAIKSPAFGPSGPIPKKYTCDGPESSPPLEWEGVPASTKSFVVIVDDPDAPDPAAPQRVWVHWVLYAIPATVRSLPEGASSSGLPSGTQVGNNDWGKATYGGPCPPKGRHRYFHKLYALDTILRFSTPHPTKTEVESAMKGHVLAHAELVGTYVKAR